MLSSPTIPLLTNYTVPTLHILPAGYDCYVQAPYWAVGERLQGGAGRVLLRRRVYHGGEIKDEYRAVLEYRDGRLVGDPPEPFQWRAASAEGSDEPGFLETGFRTEDGAARIANNILPGIYASYSAPGRKSFFTDPPLKFASPPIIMQIAAYGRYVEGQAIVRLDRDRDFGETIAFLNPYHKAILCQIVSHDGRTLRRLRVPPLSGRYARLIELLGADERSWVGQVQLTANNRLATFDLKHSLSDPRNIHHCEHLDPFRGEPTHLPAFQWLRIEVGRLLASHVRRSVSRS